MALLKAAIAAKTPSVSFTFRGIEIDVTGYFEEGFLGCDSRNPEVYDPGSAGYIDDMSVYIGDDEVTEILSEDVLKQIEEEALGNYFRKD